MKTTKIIVKDGEGRPVNPFSHKFSTPEHKEFEANVKSNIAPNIPDGTHMARLQWQYEPQDEDYFEWRNCDESKFNMINKWNKEDYRHDTIRTRQIWVLSPDGEGEKKEKVSQVFYIYCYDSVRGWVKLPSNPKHGYSENEMEEITLKAKQQAEKYPGREFTIMGIITKFTI